jgi:rod shape-determining protein MreD
MRKAIVWAIIVVAAALIQTTWPNVIKFKGVVPDLTVLIVVYYAIVEGEERAMYTGALGGLFQDVAGQALLGLNILCNVIVGYALGRLATRLITDHPAIKVTLVFVASLVQGLLVTLVSFLQDPSLGALGLVAGNVIPGAFYTALVTPLVFYLLDRSLRRLTPTQGSLP